MWEKAVVFVAFFFCNLNSSVGVLTGYQDPKDITLDPNFNCRWLGGPGGRDSTLTCSCMTGTEEFYIKNKSIPRYEVRAINITNCGKIRFGANAVSDMRSLRVIELRSINSLILEENSFHWVGFTRQSEFLVEPVPDVPSIRISIENTTVSEISKNAVQGRISRIALTDVVVEHVASFGFTSLQQTVEVVFDGVEFRELSPQSFKKFATNRLVIKNSEFGLIPSRAFYDIMVRDEFLLTNITVDTLRPAGFIINNPKSFELSNSNFNSLNGDGFKVMTRGDVLIKNNVFNSTGIGAFKAITTSKEEELDLQTITFDMNIFHELSKDSLVIDEGSFIPKFNNLQLSEICECRNLERYFRNGENVRELKCLVKDNEWITVDEFKKYYCSVLTSATTTILIAVGVFLFLLVLGAIGIVCYIKRLYRCGSYGESSDDKQGKLSMIVPDGRTYRETELHVIVERADLLTTDL